MFFLCNEATKWFLFNALLEISSCHEMIYYVYKKEMNTIEPKA